MPIQQHDPNTKKIFEEIHITNRQLRELTNVLKAGLGVIPQGPRDALNIGENVVADRIPVRLDWTSPSIQGKASIVQVDGKGKIIIEVNSEDAVAFLNSVHNDAPELLLISSMVFE